MVYYFYDDEHARRAYVASLQPLARLYRDYLAFVTVDAREYGDLLAGLGLGLGLGDDAVPLAVQNPSTGDVYPYATQGQGQDHVDGSMVSADAVERFLVGIVQGQVAPWTRGRVEGDGRHEEL